MNENKYLGQQNETMGENSFMKKLLKKRLNQKGLTLIELLAVIVILAIIAAIAIPAIVGVINNSEIKATKADALVLLNAASLEKSTSGVSFGGSKTTVSDEFFTDKGSFEGVTYSISESGSTLQLTVTEANAIDAGGKDVFFTNATISTIDAKDADSDSTFVTVK